MVRLREDLKLEVVREVLNGRLIKEGASERLGIERRSVNRYIKRFLDGGPEGLRDKRRSNNRKLTLEDERRIVFCPNSGS